MKSYEERYEDSLEEIAALRTRLSEAEAENARLQAESSKRYYEADFHMRKWQQDRVRIMSATPGYKYLNRVDDPEWEKCLEMKARAEGAKAELVMALRDTLRFFDTVAEDQGITCAGTTMRHARLLVKENESLLPAKEKQEKI